MNKSNKLSGVDVTKLIMSFAVIGIHSYIFDQKNLPYFLDFIVSLAVPFFIIASGYLYSRNYGLRTNQLSKISLKYLRLYVKWIIIYLPLVIFDYIQNDGSIYARSITFARKLLFTGSNPFSYHLWYLLAVAVACQLIYLLGKVQAPIYIIWIIGICFMGTGYWLENTEVTAGVIFKQIFETSNNGFTFGLGAFTSGMLLYKIKTHAIFISITLLLLSIFLYSIHNPFYSLVGGASLFLFSVSLGLIERSMYKKIRDLSTWIYFIHMYPVFFVMTAILKGWIHLNRFEGWLLVSCVTLIFASILNKLASKKYTILIKMIK